jgi:hypothetical protein
MKKPLERVLSVYTNSETAIGMATIQELLKLTGASSRSRGFKLRLQAAIFQQNRLSCGNGERQPGKDLHNARIELCPGMRK